jgi:hypothetical protein
VPRPTPLPSVVALAGCVLLALVPVERLDGQTGSMRASVPSPTAASLGQFGDVPVSLSSGLPDVAIPLFTLTGHTLELPITLRYAGGGILVEEIGGWVGLGWALEAGGVITRTVRGVADEKPGGYWHTGHTWYEPANWPNPGINPVQEVADGTLDGEPDQFFFNFAGRAGQFVMGPTDSTGAVREVRSIPYQRLRIEPIDFTSPQSKWVITTEDGTRYTFDAREVHTDYNVSDPPVMATSDGTHVSSWYLTEIQAPGGDVISFYYSPYTTRHRRVSYVERFDYRLSASGNPCVPSEVMSTNTYDTQGLRLDSIQAGRHTARFLTGDSLRADALHPDTGARQEPRLNEIVISTALGEPLKRFRFEHDYFGGNRLRLDAVHEQDATGNPLPPWTFAYDPQSFPERASKSQDHWGFWNGSSNTTLIPVVLTPFGSVLSGGDRSPNPEKSKVGSLTRINYPTGGFTEFTWESHDYGKVGADTAHVVALGEPQSEVLVTIDYEQWTSTTFTIGGVDSTAVSLSVQIDPWDSECQVGCSRAEIVGVGTWASATETLILMAPGTYTLQAYADAEGNVTASVAWQDREVAKKATAGGLRIAEIFNDDGRGNRQERTFSYTLQSDPERSSGVVGQEPIYQYHYNDSQCSYLSRSSASRLPLGGRGSVSYSEATVHHGVGGEFGSTRETYRGFAHAPDLLVDPGVWPFSRKTTREWMRGQRIDRTEYNDNDEIQQRVRTTYVFHEIDPTTSRHFRGLSVNSFSAGELGSTYVYNPFEVVSAWYHPASDTTVVYDESGGTGMSVVRTYEYGNPEHLQLTELREVNSDGTERITRMRYPADYDTEGGNPDNETEALTAMKGDRHMHSAVIERWVEEVAGSIGRIIEAELTTFTLRNFPDRILPYRRFVLDRTDLEP